MLVKIFFSLCKLILSAAVASAAFYVSFFQKGEGAMVYRGSAKVATPSEWQLPLAKFALL